MAVQPIFILTDLDLVSYLLEKYRVDELSPQPQEHQESTKHQFAEEGLDENLRQRWVSAREMCEV